MKEQQHTTQREVLSLTELLFLGQIEHLLIQKTAKTQLNNSHEELLPCERKDTVVQTLDLVSTLS